MSVVEGNNVSFGGEGGVGAWIYAATLDRYLLSVAEKQKFGTQYTSSDGCTFALEPYDPTTTDEARAEYGVPPLAAALKQAEMFGECDAEESE